MLLFPSPHSGILFLCNPSIAREYPNYKEFPSPHSGILFLSGTDIPAAESRTQSFRPLIRGFFFYDTDDNHECGYKFKHGFRPLIRGFFFYNTAAFMFDGNGGKFPSPHSGILFLYKHGIECLISGLVFPSPHSGILFLFAVYTIRFIKKKTRVSVPSFGDSFFITVYNGPCSLMYDMFPSPHSGILFL